MSAANGSFSAHVVDAARLDPANHDADRTDVDPGQRVVWRCRTSATSSTFCSC
jgi:hypothetical protein